MNWYLAVIKKYATFSGRARRTEYWMFILFNLLVALGVGIVDAVIGAAPALGLLYSLALLLPSIAVAVRRLHDTGRSGWWLLLVFLPVVGAIVLLVFAVQEGNRGDNAYGPDPKAQAPIQQTIAA